jgi:hypothetical protein
MRQVYRLLGLARRYDDHRVETACAQALALDVVDVGVITRILERGREHTPPGATAVAQQLPLRFTRHPESIAPDGANRPHRDTGAPPLRASTGRTEAGFPGTTVICTDKSPPAEPRREGR